MYKLCDVKDCYTYASYGKHIDDIARVCYYHSRLKEYGCFYNVRTKKKQYKTCIVDNCDKFATFGTTSRAIHCKDHKQDGEYNSQKIRKKICVIAYCNYKVFPNSKFCGLHYLANNIV